MQTWKDVPFTSAVKLSGGSRRLDGLAVWPYDLHRGGPVADDYHVEWGNMGVVVLEGATPANRGMEGWIVCWPVAADADQPRLVLGTRTLDAAKAYCDERWPMPPWWHDVHENYCMRPPVRVI